MQWACAPHVPPCKYVRVQGMALVQGDKGKDARVPHPGTLPQQKPPTNKKPLTNS